MLKPSTLHLKPLSQSETKAHEAYLVLRPSSARLWLVAFYDPSADAWKGHASGRKLGIQPTIFYGPLPRAERP